MTSIAASIDTSGLARLLRNSARPGTMYIVGVTGSVAVGKSTLCAGITAALAPHCRTQTVSTDGFLLPNDILTARGLTMRKGYPESYDTAALREALEAVRARRTIFPGYSHTTYEPDPALAREINAPDILIVEGLALSPAPDGRNPADALDALVYLDAEEHDLETWFVDRFIGLWRQAETDPTSFYARFRAMTEPEVAAFAHTVWAQINLPNLREHIIHARDHAHIVVHKAADHGLRLVRPAAS